jgi:ferredoxin
VRGEEPRGGGVLRSEVFEQFGIVDVAHPGVRVVDVTGGAAPGVRASGGDRRSSGGGDGVGWVGRCVGCLIGLLAHGRANVDSQRYRSVTMRVWIDQDLCTGDGLCVDHCPDVFVQLEDGIAYVVEGGEVLNDPGGSGSLAWVSERNVSDAIHAAELCPGECIFIEVEPASSVDDVPDLVDLADDAAA